MRFFGGQCSIVNIVVLDLFPNFELTTHAFRQYTPVRPRWRPYSTARATEKRLRAHQGRHKLGGNALTRLYKIPVRPG